MQFAPIPSKVAQRMRRIFLPVFALALALATTPVFAESTVETPTKTDVPASAGKSDAIVDAPNTPILETIVVRGCVSSITVDNTVAVDPDTNSPTP